MYFDGCKCFHSGYVHQQAQGRHEEAGVKMATASVSVCWDSYHSHVNVNIICFCLCLQSSIYFYFDFVY